MVEQDYFAIITRRYQQDLANAWNRVVNYYNEVAPDRLKGIKGLAPDGTISFYDSDSDYGLVITDFNFNITDSTFNPIVAHEEVIENNGETTVTHVFTFTKNETDTFTMGFTEGLKVGAKATAKAQIPFVGEGSVEVNGEISFGASQQWVTSKSNILSYTDSVPVPARTHMRCTGYIKRQTLKASYTASCYATEGVALTWFQYDNGYFTEFDVPINVLLTPDQLKVALAGVFSGGEGVETYASYDPVTIPTAQLT